MSTDLDAATAEDVVDLDALLDYQPEPARYFSVGTVTSAAVIAEIKACKAYSKLWWWQRLATPTPKGWR